MNLHDELSKMIKEKEQNITGETLLNYNPTNIDYKEMSSETRLNIFSDNERVQKFLDDKNNIEEIIGQLNNNFAMFESAYFLDLIKIEKLKENLKKFDIKNEYSDLIYNLNKFILNKK